MQILHCHGPVPKGPAGLPKGLLPALREVRAQGQGEMHQSEKTRLVPQSGKAYYDLMTAVMVCLGAEDDQNYEGLLKLLDVLFSTEANLKEKQEILEQEFSIGMTQAMESEVSLMCNLSQGIEEKGIQKGIQEGKKEERQRGIQAMVSVLKDLNIAEDVIVKKLEEKFGLSAGQARKYIG